jgi:hypothetical protein
MASSSTVRVVIGTLVLLSICAGVSLATEDDDGEFPVWSWFAGLRLQGDFVTDLPGGRDDLERGLARLTGGVRRQFGNSWEAVASIDAGQGSDDNRDNRSNLDNERSDDLRADRLAMHWYGGALGNARLGKERSAAILGPMVWDGDLRPIGAAWIGGWNVGRLDSLGLIGAYYHPDHPLERGTDSRLAVVQADWRIHGGAPRSGAVTLSIIEFSEVEGLAESGLGRTNRRVEGRFVSDFELIDLQLAGRLQAGSWPVRAILNTVVNTGADRSDEDTGVFFSLRAGSRRNRGDWEVGAATQRIQKDAVLAAFNDDDWWFPSATRGTRAWVAHGVRDNLWVRLSAAVERRDDLSDRLHRVLLDIRFTTGSKGAIDH